MTLPGPASSGSRPLAVGLATVAMAGALASVRVANTWLVIGLAGALAVALAFRIDARALRLRLAPVPGATALGLAVGAAMAALSVLAAPPLARAFPALGEAIARAYEPLYAWPGAPLALPVIALVVFAEELVWRGVLLEHLEPRARGVRCIALGAGIYACTQLGAGSVLLVCVALACGAVWTALRLRTGSLLAPLAAHGVWAAAVFVIWPLG